MRWEGQRESDNVEDRRGMGPARVGGLGLGGIVLVLAVSYFTGINPLTLINMLSDVQVMTESPAPSEPAQTGSPNDRLGKFASVVLADTETTWRQLLGPRYEDPRLVLFTGAVQSACGTTSSAVGYADTHPLASNDSEDGRSSNRRIEIVLYPKDLKEIAGQVEPNTAASK